MKNNPNQSDFNRFLLLTCIWLVICQGRVAAEPVPKPVQSTKDLRSMILSTDPRTVGIRPTAENPNVWGILMETGYPKALVTLVSLVDGTTSLYWGSGGGIIGGGGHESVRNASKKFINLAEQNYSKLTPTRAFPFPDIGRVKFYILTYGGIFTADLDENELGLGKHEFSELFYAGHEVIGELRQLQERK